MKLEDKSSGKEQEQLLQMLDSMIEEYESGHILDSGIEGADEVNSPIETSEYFSGEYNSKARENRGRGHHIVSDGEPARRANALKQAKMLIEQATNKEQPYTNEKCDKIRYSILEVLELDRKRISSDLHDSTVQILTMLVHKAELCEKLIEKDAIRTKMELGIMSNVLKDAISELRQTIFNLRPMSMDDLGLMDSIERYLQILNQSSDVTFLMDIDNENGVDVEQLLSPVQKLSLYRMLQECCSNISKHSEADKALITFRVRHDEAVLSVEDNGRGFENLVIVDKINEINNSSGLERNKYFQELSEMIAARNDFSGYGLSMLQERVYLLDGRLRINSKKDGCKIVISIPIITKEEGLNEAN